MQEDKAIQVDLQHPEYLTSAISLAITMKEEWGTRHSEKMPADPPKPPWMKTLGRLE